jgi:acyl-CoA synthetase (AMP-forming)/AMP-acid ligase II
MPSPSPDRAAPCLRELIETVLSARSDASPVLDDGVDAVALQALATRSWVEAPQEAVLGRNLLLITRRPLSAAVALCSLDGVANRLVVVPPDLAMANLGSVIEDAEATAIIHDGIDDDQVDAVLPRYRVRFGAEEGAPRFAETGRAAEWCLFTSGTTGPPKMVVHSLAGLTDAIPRGGAGDGAPPTWATFYDVRRYGGLQMLLRALVGGHTLYLMTPGESLSQFLTRISGADVTHVAGTPTHWRSALTTREISSIAPRYVRLSGEVADQSVLDRLSEQFPATASGHAYASTEAGVGFEVTDGREGFPVAFLDRAGAVEMKIQDDTLRIRSPRIASRYLGAAAPGVAEADGFVDTGDIIEQRGDRLYFMGRTNGVINVGGLKVHPEEVEAIINRCPGVRMSRVKGRANPITGAIVAADVVLAEPTPALGDQAREKREMILERCRESLAAFKVPASVKFVESLPTTAAGKLDRRAT